MSGTPMIMWPMNADQPWFAAHGMSADHFVRLGYNIDTIYFQCHSTCAALLSLFKYVLEPLRWASLRREA